MVSEGYSQNSTAVSLFVWVGTPPRVFHLQVHPEEAPSSIFSHSNKCSLQPGTSMNLLQRIILLFRRLYNSPPVRLTIRYVLSLYSFLVSRGRKKKGGFSASPDFSGKHSVIELPPSSTTLPGKVISTTICASRLPVENTLHPYPFGGPSVPASSQDVSAWSVHSEADAQRSSRHLLSVSRSNRSGNLDYRNRSNPHIDIPAISGHHARLSGSASRLSSRPTSFLGQGSRPASLHTISRSVSPYPSSHGSRIDINVERGPDDEEFDSMPMQTSPIQEGPPYTLAEITLEREVRQLSEVHERFRPMPPENHSRYERLVFVPDERTTYTIKPLTSSFGFEKELPTEWKKLIHPEGACYYAYQDGRYYTDANIMDDLTKDRIVTCITDFDDFTRSLGVELSLRTNTVFNLRTDEGNPDDYICEYYIADHASRSVFWLDTVDADTFSVWWEVKGVTSATHIEHAVVSQYWYHCHLFPHSYSLTVEVVDELRDILSHSICDTITSSTSTVPYSVSDLKEMMLLLNNLRSKLHLLSCSIKSCPFFSENPSTGGGVSAYSRIMYIFARLRFLHFNGQPGARLDRDQSIHYKADRLQHRRPWWMRSLSPALFSAPDLYYRILSTLWVDSLVHEAAWADFVGKMNEEWQQVILFNTVLLNANVAFLAIQSVDNSSDSPGRSPAQIASFLSIVASFGSIILGLVLARKHRAKAKDTAEDAAKFLRSWERNRLGVASLAILYSVPYALLMWGVLCFLVAFSFMCYSNSDVLIRSLMSSAWFFVAVLVLWCVTALASWDHRSNDQASFWTYVHDLLSYLLFGLWWLTDGVVAAAIKGWVLLQVRLTTVQEPQQRPVELQNIRKSSVGTVVGELWRKSSLFSRTDRKSTGDTQVTAVEP
ncbi:hypothetical protein J3R30DRAFT_3360973 [Lentinula aciculospora]|uniref:WW domain-containing protein n=1 Tax=Lentinula aciculospora TaxID=153920 RepID=A0A9W9DWV3_9AGAR|nr:hypothetical protein J3R30DRAFT_3360973 [Lentinula aciculospora]